MISQKDQLAIDLLKDFKAAKTEFFQELIWKNLRYTQKRLKMLSEDYKVIKRDRDKFTNQYYYWIPGAKPGTLSHPLILTTFYARCNNFLDIRQFKGPFQIYNLRPDGFISFRYKNKFYMYFIEIQISPKRKEDIIKYKNLLYSNKWQKQFQGVFPRILFITNQKIEKDNELTIIKIREDLSDIRRII